MQDYILSFSQQPFFSTVRRCRCSGFNAKIEMLKKNLQIGRKNCRNKRRFHQLPALGCKVQTLATFNDLLLVISR